MKPRTFARWCALFLVAALWANLDRALLLMQGTLPERGSAQTGAPQYIREALLLFLALAMVNFIAKRKAETLGKVTIHSGVFLVGVAIAAEVVRTLLMGSPPSVVGFGLRTFGLAFIYMGLRWFKADDARLILAQVARYAKPLVLAEFALAAYQVRTSPALFGETFAGARPWGSLSAPNNFSAMCVSLALLFAVGRPKRWPLWMLMCLGFAFLSGSRTGVLGVVIIVVMLVFRHVPYKVFLLPLAGVGMWWILNIASSEALSGRVIEGEGRFDGWAKILGSMDFMDLVLGTGVGLGSNATLSTYGYENAEAVVADSQLVSFYLSFGFAGIAIILWGLLAMWRQGDRSLRQIYVPVIVVLGAVYNIGEYAPANLILVLVAGAYASRAYPQVKPEVTAEPETETSSYGLTRNERLRYLDGYSRAPRGR